MLLVLLVPLVFALFTPLAVPAFAWWASALNYLPMIAAMAWVCAEAILLVRTGSRRHAISGAIAFALIIVSLLVGMAGYRWLEGLAWIDAFLNAAMLLGGMGPIHTPVTEGGKLFAGLYALYCGLAVILVAGVILAPIAHRILHRFHMESRER